MLKLLISLVPLPLCLALPGGTSSWFNGLPWTTGLETVTMMVFVPICIVVGWRFLLLGAVQKILIMLFVISSFIAIAAPKDGLSIKIYPTTFDFDDGRWLRTYATLWNKDASGLLVRAWPDKAQFPIEWALPKLTSSTEWSERFNKSSAPDDWEDAEPVLEVSGSLRLLVPGQLVLFANGVIDKSVVLVDRNQNEKIVRIEKPNSDIELDSNEVIAGEWSIKGSLTYAGPDWSLMPVLITNKKNDNLPLKNIQFLQHSLEGLPSSARVKAFQFVGTGYSLCLMGFFLAWFLWAIFDLMKKGALTWQVLSFSFVSVLMLPLAIRALEHMPLGSGINLGGAPLGLIVLLSGGTMMLLSNLAPKLRKALEVGGPRVVILLFGLPVLTFYLVRWWPGIDQVSFLTKGDDWTHYQLLAFRIATWGELLSGGGEPMFYYQPLYRYVVALFHWLFGKSFVPQQLFDVWCVLGGAAFIVAFARRWGVSGSNALLGSMLYLVPVLMGPVRHHIGRGLSEHTSMLLLISAAWILVSKKNHYPSHVVVAAILGVFGYWTRQDHLLLTAPVALLICEPIVGSFKSAWMELYKLLRRHWLLILIFISILAIGVLLILFRSWALSGEMWLNPKDHPNYVFVQRYGPDGAPIPIKWQPTYFLQKIYLIIAMKSWGILPSPFSIVMILGTVFGLLALVWRPILFHRLPISIGLILIGAFLPYYFADNWGYAPRYSIHVLPFATVSFIIVWDQWIKLIAQYDKIPMAIGFSRIFGGASPPVND